MKNKIRIACVQNSAAADPQRNLARVDKLVQQALKYNPDLIALPENFYWRGQSRDLKKVAAQTPSLIKHFQKIARAKKICFLLGSVLESSLKENKFFSTAVFISEKGKVTAKYKKIHLFSIHLKQVETDESRNICPGNKVTTVKFQGVRVGLSICYDLRFPELYRQLTAQGAKILFVPANFTYVTGEAHWEILLRARAIENQAFVVAPGQVGLHPSNKIKSFGTTLIIDPWGRVLAKGSDFKEEIVFSELDLKVQSSLRKSFPVLKNRVLRERF